MGYIHKHIHTYIGIFSGRHVLLQLGTQREEVILIILKSGEVQSEFPSNHPRPTKNEITTLPFTRCPGCQKPHHHSFIFFPGGMTWTSNLLSGVTRRNHPEDSWKARVEGFFFNHLHDKIKWKRSLITQHTIKWLGAFCSLKTPYSAGFFVCLFV